MPRENGVERAIGRLEGKVDGIARRLDDHIADEQLDLKAVRNELRGVREDLLVGKVQKRMALFVIGMTSGVASALATLKATLGKIWPF